MKKLTKALFISIIILLFSTQLVMADGLNLPAEDQIVLNKEFVIKSGENYYGDVVSFNGSVIIEEDASLYGDLVAFGGDVELKGNIIGNVISFGTEFDEGYAELVYGETINLGASSKRIGDLSNEEKPLSLYLNPASVQGLFDKFWNGFGAILGVLLTGLIFSTVSVLLYMLGKDRFQNTLKSLRKEPVFSFLVGLILFIITPIFLLILSITIILIPIALVGILIFILMIAVSISVLGQMIGKFLMDLFKADWTEVIQTGVGTFVFSFGLSFLMKLPCIGWSLSLLIVSFAMGAFVISSFGSKSFSRDI